MRWLSTQATVGLMVDALAVGVTTPAAASLLGRCIGTEYDLGCLSHPIDGPQPGVDTLTCHNASCNRYRVAARTQTSPDSTTDHIGIP